MSRYFVSFWVVEQKVNYIHSNPFEEGFVTNALDWKYSSARNYAGDQIVLVVELMGSEKFF